LAVAERAIAFAVQMARIEKRAEARSISVAIVASAAVRNDAVKHLNWPQDPIGDDLLDRVVVTTGTEAYRRADGVAIVPAGLLGP